MTFFIILFILSLFLISIGIFGSFEVTVIGILLGIATFVISSLTSVSTDITYHNTKVIVSGDEIFVQAEGCPTQTSTDLKHLNKKLKIKESHTKNVWGWYIMKYYNIEVVPENEREK